MMKFLLLLCLVFFQIKNLYAEGLVISGDSDQPRISADVSAENFTEENTQNKKINSEVENPQAVFHPKKTTPSRFFSTDISMPSHFSTSNNLAKKVGSFYRAYGEIIFLQGTITDSFGVPIDGAIIEIWQTNAAGKYHTLLEDGSEYIDKYFNMSGRTITDNLGNYHFITIMPGANTGRAPHINMNIYHSRFGKIETEMYFEKYPFNITDYQYLAYDEDERKLLTAQVRHSNPLDPRSIKVVNFNITMKGIHQYKHY